MKPSQVTDMLEIAFKAKHNVLMYSSPGVGKTSLVYEVANKLGYDVEVFHPVVSDPTDFKGLPWVTNGKADFLPFGNLSKLITAEKPTVAFLDDLGQAPPAVQAAAMQLLLARRINEHEVSKQVTFVAATNRREDRAGVSGLLEPVKSRFAITVQLDADVPDWCAWALRAEVNLPFELVSFIRFRPNLLCEFVPSKGKENSPCPRTVEHVGRILQAGYPQELEYELYEGAAGKGFAAEFIAFLGIYRKLPNPDLVLMDPMKAEIPDDPATLFALTACLASKATKVNFERVIQYANRLQVKHPEFDVLLVTDAVKRNKDLAACKPFTQWAIGHTNVI